MRKTFVVLLVALFAVGLVWLGCSEEPTSVTGPTTESQQAAKLIPAAVGIEKVMAIQDQHTPRLMAIRGVVGTATGLGPEGKPAVLVLTKAPGITGIQRSLNGIPVIVKVTGEIRALKGPPPGKGKKEEVDPTSRFNRPVPIGVSTGNQGECSAGTIGARVIGGGKVYALSNNHVYALENSADIGSNVLQPGLYDTDCNIDPNDVIGTLFASEEIKFDGSENEIDAAIALSSTANLGNATPSNGYGTPKSAIIISAELGQKVQKYGRTTALTKGQVTGLNGTFYVGYSSGTALFVNQIVVEARNPFIKAGDSGSLLVTDHDRTPVGLLFAGNRSGKFALANKIDRVLSAFTVTIDGE